MSSERAGQGNWFRAQVEGSARSVFTCSLPHCSPIYLLTRSIPSRIVSAACQEYKPLTLSQRMCYLEVTRIGISNRPTFFE